MRSIFRVGGAILIGAGIVGGVLIVKHRSEYAQSADTPALVVARGDVRSVQPAIDSDKDGIPDWEETLRGTDPQKYTTLSQDTSTSATTTPYTPPVTLTGQFSEHFLENILRSGAGKTMTKEEQDAVVQQSLGALDSLPQDKRYTQLDIKSIADNSLGSLRAYGNAVGDILKKNSIHNRHELVIVFEATKSADPTRLQELLPIERAYAGMIRDMLLLEAPSNLAKQHVDLLNALSIIHGGLVAMQQIFSDPLPSLVRVQRYEEDAKGLWYGLTNIRAMLETQHIAYTSGEPGVILFSIPRP